MASPQNSANATPLAFLRIVGVRQVRLACGLILFSYLLSHYFNHALGNISLDALEYGLRFHMAFWLGPIGAAAALSRDLRPRLTRLTWALYQRRYFRWKTTEIVQLTLGLLIPVMLCGHLIGERLGLSLYGLHRTYALALYNFWVARPDFGVLQAALVLVAWIHGCIGLYFWHSPEAIFFQCWLHSCSRSRCFCRPSRCSGTIGKGRNVRTLAQEAKLARAEYRPGFDRHACRTREPCAHKRRLFAVLRRRHWFCLRSAWRSFLNERRPGTIRLSYPDRMVRIPKGLSVLEASYRHHVPHANVCGGKGRCSTCRIRIVGDLDGLPPPSPREAFVLDRIGASADPAVRLACQLRPGKDLAIVPLLPPQIGTAFLHGGQRMHPGEERYVVSMFVDMRGSTQMAADQLPFDTVFIVNRFLGAVSKAVTEGGGKVNQFLGDGLLALIGVDTDARTACRAALRAAAMIAANVEHLNRELAEAARSPVRFGIGINGGDVIVGDIGYGENVAYTALGDAVNVAARLQDMTKEFGCQAVVSDEVCKLAGFASGASQGAEIKVRGRPEPVVVRKVADAATLAPVAHATT